MPRVVEELQDWRINLTKTRQGLKTSVAPRTAQWMGKMLTKFPSAETGLPEKTEMIRIPINYPVDQLGTETDHPPETEITRGEMEGADLLLRKLPLREDPDLETRGKDTPTLLVDVLYKRNC